MSDSSLEAKICVLGAQGVGKTSLVERFVNGTFTPKATLSTVGASFVTKRTIDVDSGTPVRLQIWDTAGQERFRSITKLYYRGASAVVLVYSIIDENSFDEMGSWLQEVKRNLGDDIIIHVVGTKSDIVAEDPSRRQIPFERCIAYVAENLYPSQASTPPPTASSPGVHFHISGDSKRNSGFWGMEVGWDVCHEISASSGEGIDEVFRVITRKLVELRDKELDTASTPRVPLSRPDTGDGYFDRRDTHSSGSFRIGHGDKRKSWLGGLTPTVIEDEQILQTSTTSRRRNGRCC